MTIRLGDELAADLSVVSRVTGTSESEIIRASLMNHLDNVKRQPSFRSAFEKMIAKDKAELERIYGRRSSE